MIPENYWYYMSIVASAGSIEGGSSLLFIKLNLPTQTVIQNDDGSEEVVEQPPVRFTTESDAEAIALECMTMMTDNAPESIRDDFSLCCAHHIYRVMLMDAVDNGSIDVILHAQNAILKLTER